MQTHEVEKELRKTVATGGAILYHLGLADYMGHCSARVPGTDRIVIKPRHSSLIHGMGTVTPEQMVIIDMDGKTIEGELNAPAERYIYTEIYKRHPHIGGIAHTHQMMSVAFGVAEKPILPVLQVEAGLVTKNIPIFRDPELVDDGEKGRLLAEALDGHSIIHIQNHGIVFTGPTVQEAVLASIHLERLATLNLFATMLGGVKNYISEEKVREMEGGKGVNFSVRWGYYASLLETGALNARAVVGSPPIAQHLNMAK